MRLLRWLFICFVLAAPAAAQRGALTTPQNIAQLSQRAATVVRGQVFSVRIEPHPQLTNLTTVVVTLQVSQKLKGSSGSLLTFRQFVWDIRDKYEAAGYRKGQDLLLLLNPISSYGLTSPVGMDQGRFEISRDKHGALIAINGVGNVGLFSNMKTSQVNPKISAAANALISRQPSGPLPLLQLQEIIQTFAGVTR